MQNVSDALTESMRILIVEDDASLASGVSRILEAEGYAVDMTSRGEEAVEAAKRERFDLVILDIGLPDAHGGDLLRTLRRMSDTKSIGVTGHGFAHEPGRPIDSGDGYAGQDGLGFVAGGAAD